MIWFCQRVLQGTQRFASHSHSPDYQLKNRQVPADEAMRVATVFLDMDALLFDHFDHGPVVK